VRTCINLMITMLLGGLWHGASWTFIAWGAIHGAALIIERVWWSAIRKPDWPRLSPVLGVMITFNVVCLAWILFRSDSFATAMAYLQGLGRLTAPTLLTPFIVSLIVGGLALHALPPRAIERTASWLCRIPSPAAGLTIGLLILLVEAVRAPGVAPFIYFQF
jgi:alginate O-acetyltransferase complex protein AlgI